MNPIVDCFETNEQKQIDIWSLRWKCCNWYCTSKCDFPKEMKKTVVFLTVSKLFHCHLVEYSLHNNSFSSSPAKIKTKNESYFFFFFYLYSPILIIFLLYLTALSIAIPIPRARLSEHKVYSIEQSVTHSTILWTFF